MSALRIVWLPVVGAVAASAYFAFDSDMGAARWAFVAVGILATAGWFALGYQAARRGR